MKKLEEKILNLIEKDVNQLGYELYDVEYNKKSQDYYLTIYIDSEQGITLEDCEKVSDAIGDLLDEADYIEEQYFLEVSSPGLERTLRLDKHLEKAIGKEIEINLYTKVNNIKHFRGKLKDFTPEEIIILADEEEQKIERKNIAIIKQVYNWE